MFTLLQILTFDAWITDVLRPILKVLLLTAQLVVFQLGGTLFRLLIRRRVAQLDLRSHFCVNLSCVWFSVGPLNLMRQRLDNFLER